MWIILSWSLRCCSESTSQACGLAWILRPGCFLSVPIVDHHHLYYMLFRLQRNTLKYRCALLYFYHIYVGVIDRTNISNIWRYLCPIVACVVSNIGLSTFHLKLFASAHSIYLQFSIIDMDSFLLTM